MTTLLFEKTNASLNLTQVRADFPILQQKIQGKSLVYLDNAATTQKPKAVIETIKNYYLHENANIHRGVHTLSQFATTAFEQAREKIRCFINAKHAYEIIFVSGTTAGINLVADSFGRLRIKADDEIIISTMEHHSNIVPWQLLCERTGAKLRIIPVTEVGELDLVAYENLLTKKTKLVAITHVSNVLGTINPVQKMIQLAHAHNVAVLLDGAQGTPHLQIDVQALDCDFYVFSAHKMYGPTGVGVVYGKAELLEAMPPYQAGGNMISQVTFDKTTFSQLPGKFEAGTPNIADVIGFGATIDYLNHLGMSRIKAQEEILLTYATEKLTTIPGLRIIGTAQEKAAVIAFVLADIHPHDIGTVLDHEGIAIRAGHHCAMPLMDRFQVPATVRASFSFYNTKEEVDALVDALVRVKRLFK